MSGLLKSGIKMIYKSNFAEAVTSLSAGNDIVIMAMPEASPVSSLEKAASTSMWISTPTLWAASLQVKRKARRTSSRQGRSLSAILKTVRTTAQRASAPSITTTAAMTR